MRPALALLFCFGVSMSQAQSMRPVTVTSIERALELGSIPIHLDLYGQGLTTIPCEILDIDSLVDLELGGNPDLEFDSVLVMLQSASNLRRLSIEDNRLDSIPAAVLRLTQLGALNASGNTLTRLPEALDALTGLEVLDLYSNHITQLPTCLGRMPALRVLNMNGNRLTSLPASMRHSHLRVLRLGLNPELKAGEYFARLGRMDSLDTLQLYDTGIDVLRRSIGKLKRLSYLDISVNDFTTIDPRLAELQQLKVLAMRDATFRMNEPLLRRMLPSARFERINR